MRNTKTRVFKIRKIFHPIGLRLSEMFRTYVWGKVWEKISQMSKWLQGRIKQKRHIKKETPHLITSSVHSGFVKAGCYFAAEVSGA